MIKQVDSILLMCVLLGGASQAFAIEPYVPASDDVIIERLPRELIDGQRELSALQRGLRSNPDDADLAARVAAKYIELGSAGSDPRYYGYAQAALGPWWESATAPPTILRLRAKLKEKEHRYDDALHDLRQLIEQEPEDVQAWIERSNIYRVQGRYDDAQQACDRLNEIAGSLAVLIAQAPLSAVTGKAEQAYAELGQIPASAQDRLGGVYQWILNMRAELARILGRNSDAQQHFEEALSNNPKDAYTLRAYADFLLDQNQPRRALDLIRDQTADNGLLLRATIAARRAGDRQADPWQAQLASRFEEIRLRGETPHGRFESRFALELEHDPAKALDLALANWARQKEARDTRNLLEAALAAKNPAAAKEAMQFLRDNSTEDVTLQALVHQLESQK